MDKESTHNGQASVSKKQWMGIAFYPLFVFGVFALAASFLITPRYVASLTTIGHLSKYSRVYVGLIRVAIFHAGLLSIIASITLRFMKRSVSAANEDRPRKIEIDLFVVSFLILFMELAMIRWIPGYVKLMSYFSNFILLACMLGMGLGCLAAGSKINFMKSVGFLLSATIIISLLIFSMGKLNLVSYSLSRLSESQYIHFGGEWGTAQASLLNFGVTIIIAIVFVLITAIFIGPGQVMGSLFNSFKNPVQAYTINIAASIVGIVCFSVLSFLSAPAWIWFTGIAVMVIWLLIRHRETGIIFYAAAISIALFMVIIVSTNDENGVTIWSPYYKIFYEKPRIIVNEIGHQSMVSSRENFHYNLPYLLSWDTTGRRFNNILIIGAGSGNDVSYALRYGASRIVAVEIDPVILKIGKKDHPDRPYDDARVQVINNDGRSFLRSSNEKFDMIIYGLVDSLTLMSSFSSVRLENYLFTLDAFEDVKRHLKPDGVFVMYNFFRLNWLTARLYDMLARVFGEEPVLINLPPAKMLTDDTTQTSAISVFMAGDINRIKTAFVQSGGYRVPRAPHEDLSKNHSFNGFNSPANQDFLEIYDTKIIRLAAQYFPIDNWPFIYLKNPKIPGHNKWGLIMMAVLSTLLICFFTGPKGLTKISLHYFFLGGAFMLLETESVIKLALIHGSTWFVNSVVFASVLVMIFLANLLILKRPIRRIIPIYILLFITLAINYLLPVELFLGKNWFVENVLSALLMFSPIAFAGIVFANSFRNSKRPALDLGSNLLGIIAGGIAEYASLVFGYNVLLLLAGGMYLISLIASPRQ